VTATAPAPVRAPDGVRAPVRPATLLTLAALVGLAVMAALLWAGDGRPAPALDGLPDAGLGTAWALPVARVLTDLAAVVTVGLLVLGAVLVPARDGELKGARLRFTRGARWGALVWTAGALAQAVLTLSAVLAEPVDEVLDPTLLWSFLVDIDLGRAFLVQALLAAIVAATAWWIRTTTGAALVALLAVAALVPPTLTAHSGGSEDHTVAVTSLMVHVIAMALWTGGVVALVLLGSADRKSFPVAVPRFSTLALWSAVAVAISGVVSASVRLESPVDLVTTSYGHMVVLKAVLITVLAGFGVWHRRRILPRLSVDSGRLLFVRVAAVEVLIMAATVGVAVALSRTPPPVPDDVGLESVSPARLLLGFDLPPPPTAAELLWGQARIDGFWLTVAVLLGALYVVGLRVLRRSGDHWPVGRTVSWYVAVALLVLSTNSGLATYAHVTFSAHMVQHMLLSMIVPIFLVLAAPITLALRTLPRGSGQVGPREWLQMFVQSRYVAVISHPVVASVIFVAGFYILYFSALFPWLMQSHWGHIAMGVHFLLAGALFFWVMIGVDPGPHRPPYIARVALMLIVMPLHSFFSVALMMTESVMAEAYYRLLDVPFVPDLLDDQHLGASLGWATGEIPIVIVMVALFLQWVRADDREARRTDRKQSRAERTGAGTDELADYNAYLASLADRDGGQGR
jgi:putative copper resistance protein D